MVRPDGTATPPTPVDGVERPSLVHDMALTEHYLVLVVAPLFFDLGRALAGGSLLAWEPDQGTRIALIPRDGGPVRWCADATFWTWHTANAYEADDPAAGNPVVLDYVEWDAPAGLTPDTPDRGRRLAGPCGPRPRGGHDPPRTALRRSTSSSPASTTASSRARTRPSRSPVTAAEPVCTPRPPTPWPGSTRALARPADGPATTSPSASWPTPRTPTPPIPTTAGGSPSPPTAPPARAGCWSSPPPTPPPDRRPASGCPSVSRSGCTAPGCPTTPSPPAPHPPEEPHDRHRRPRHRPTASSPTPTFDFEFRDALGATAYGVGDPGMWLATARQIVDGDRQSWFDAWTARADQLSGLGDAAAAQGDPRGASWAYLSASAAYSRAHGRDRRAAGRRGRRRPAPTFRSSRRCWDAMIDASAGRFVRVAVPYEDTTLPGYLLRPDASGAQRPTFVMTNGSDGSLAPVGDRRRRGARPGLERLRLRRARAAVDAVRAQRAVPPRLGGRAHPGGRRPGRPPGRRRRRAHRLRHQPGRLLAPAGAGVRAPLRRRRRRPRRRRRLHLLARPPAAADDRPARQPPEARSSTPSWRRSTRTPTRPARSPSAPAPTASPTPTTSTPRCGPTSSATSPRKISTPLLITSPQDEQFWPGQSDQLAGLLTAPHERGVVHPAGRGELPLPAAGQAADGLPNLRLADPPARPPEPGLAPGRRAQDHEGHRRGGRDHRRH